MKTIPLFLAAFLAGGCVAHTSLRKDIAPPETTAPKGAARVVVVRRPGPPASLHHRELPWASVDVDLQGYPEAAAAMLGSLYEQVSIEPTAETARGADFIVALSTDYPRTVGMTFQNGAGALLASFSQPGAVVLDNPDADSLGIKIMAPPAMVVSFGTLGLAFAYQAREAGKRISAEVSEATAKALVEIKRQIAATAALSRGLVPPMAAVPGTGAPGDLRKYAAQAEELEREAARLRAKIADLEKQTQTAHGPK